MSHPYGGNPNNFPASITLLDDGVDTPSMANFMTPIEGLADRTAWLQAQLTRQFVAAAAGNFGSIITGTTVPGPLTLTLGFADYDASLQQWMGFMLGGGDLLDFVTHASGQPWINPNSTTIPSLGVLASACDGQGHAVCVHVPSAGHTAIFLTNALGSRSGPDTQTFLNQLAQAILIYDDSAGVWVLVGAEQTGGSFTGHAASATTAIITTTNAWVDGSTGLPVSWQSGTNTIAGFVAAKDPTGAATYPVIIGMCGTTSRIMGSAGAFTDITPLFLTGKMLTGLAFNPLAGLWGALCYDGVSGAQFYTSPDQTTWTQQHIFNSSLPGGTTAGLAVVNGVWAAQLVQVNGNLFPPGGSAPANDRILLSADGVTWTSSSYSMSGSPGDNDAIGGVLGIGRLASSGNQLLAWNNGEHCFSHQSGFMSGGMF